MCVVSVSVRDVWYGCVVSEVCVWCVCEGCVLDV